MYSISNMIIQVAVNSLGTVIVASWAMSGKTDGVYWAVSNALGAAITGFIDEFRFSDGVLPTSAFMRAEPYGFTITFR